MLRLLNAQTLLEGEDRHHCAADFDAVPGQFMDVIGGLPTPLNRARWSRSPTDHAAAHMRVPVCAQYEIDQDPTKLVYPVWRDPDVLDTWFSSGLWPIGTLGWPEDTDAFQRYFPTSTLITGFDIIFFWVARMMMMQKAVADVPFRDVYVHALVRDEKGEDVEVRRQRARPAGADRRIRRRRAALHAAKHGGDGARPEAVEGPHPGLPQLRHQAVERRAVRRDERLQTVADGFDPATVTQTVNKWIVGETARARMAHDEALAALPLQRRGERALRLCLAQGLRLVSGIRQAALRLRG
jgi:valyl-tRNA synthetase